jgi:hypothetical protein
MPSEEGEEDWLQESLDADLKDHQTKYGAALFYNPVVEKAFRTTLYHTIKNAHVPAMPGSTTFAFGSKRQ